MDFKRFCRNNMASTLHVLDQKIFWATGYCDTRRWKNFFGSRFHPNSEAIDISPVQCTYNINWPKTPFAESEATMKIAAKAANEIVRRKDFKFTLPVYGDVPCLGFCTSFPLPSL